MDFNVKHTLITRVFIHFTTLGTDTVNIVYCQYSYKILSLKRDSWERWEDRIRSDVDNVKPRENWQ